VQEDLVATATAIYHGRSGEFHVDWLPSACSRLRCFKFRYSHFKTSLVKYNFRNRWL